MTEPRPDDPEAPPGQIYVCAACGKTAIRRYALRDSSCWTWAVLCYLQKNADGKWVAVLESETETCPEKSPPQ